MKRLSRALIWRTFVGKMFGTLLGLQWDLSFMSFNWQFRLKVSEVMFSHMCEEYATLF